MLRLYDNYNLIAGDPLVIAIKYAQNTSTLSTSFKELRIPKQINLDKVWSSPSYSVLYFYSSIKHCRCPRVQYSFLQQLISSYTLSCIIYLLKSNLKSDFKNSLSFAAGPVPSLIIILGTIIVLSMKDKISSDLFWGGRDCGSFTIVLKLS